MPSYYDDFYERARLLGHDETKLRNGEEVIKFILPESPQEVRRLFSVATPNQRKERQKSFYTPGLAIRARLGQGIHDRGEAFVFAEEPIHDSDQQGLNNHFPAHGKTLSILRKTVAANEVWDVTVSADIWGIDESEELYTTVNVGELILEPGAKVIVRGNVFSLLCQKLIYKGVLSENDEDYQIGILPTPFSLDMRKGPENGNDGAHGFHGRNGKKGINYQVQSTLIGLQISDNVDTQKMNGTDGAEGYHGQPGGNGRNGGMSKIAEITLRSIEGKIKVFSQAGKGGNGGHGGNGGNGGHGGDGSNGYKLISGILEGGSPGNGGNGGNAGAGGNGANGGLSSNIYINVSDQHLTQIKATSLPSTSGKAGLAGQPGATGTSGLLGQSPLPQRNQVKNGHNGAIAKNGRSGKSRHASAFFLNENRVTSVTENMGTERATTLATVR